MTMTEKLQIYKCELCGNIVEVIHTGAGELVCCGQPMTLQEEKTEDAATEKHVPWIQKTEDGIKVTVGQAALHPMEEKQMHPKPSLPSPAIRSPPASTATSTACGKDNDNDYIQRRRDF
jgi:desulfoferrodoxin-like iron-binding protein